MFKKIVLSNILFVLSLTLLSTPTFAQGPFQDSPPTESHAQINPTDPNWRFNESDSAVLRQAQMEEEGFNWWLLTPLVLLIPLAYLAINNWKPDRIGETNMRMGGSQFAYHDIQRTKKRSSKNLKERKYDRSYAP